jgi:ribose/xylose/arabinose/galactoside ABC-type transport system permease subunit
MSHRPHHFVLEIVLIALCIALAWIAPGFFSAENLLNVLRNSSMRVSLPSE